MMMRQKQLIHDAISLVSLLCETLKLVWEGSSRLKERLHPEGDQHAYKEG